MGAPVEKLRPADIVCVIDAIFGVSLKARRFFSAREYPPEGYSCLICARGSEILSASVLIGRLSRQHQTLCPTRKGAYKVL
jgi:hypothetical protein